MAAVGTWLPAVLSAGGTLLSVKGNLDAAKGARAAGVASRALAQRQAIAQEFEAAQMEQQAGQEIAASLRGAKEENRQAEYLQSRQLALAAASGASASDTTVVNLIARTAQEGSYRAALALYQGEDRARLLRMGAQGRRYEADITREGGALTEKAYRLQAKGHKYAALASILTGAGSLYEKYGGKKPKEKKLGLGPIGDDFDTAGYYSGNV